MTAPTFTWKGTSDAVEGIAIFEYHDDLQRIEIPLPNFEMAFNLNKFLQSVYMGAKMTGVLNAKYAVNNAIASLKFE